MSVSVKTSDPLYDVSARVFGVDAGTLSEHSTHETIESWDSLNHLNLIMAIEEHFQVTLTPEDTMQMHSLGAIRAILARGAAESPAEITFVDCGPEHIPSLKRFIAKSYGENYVLGVNDAYFDWQFAAPTLTTGRQCNLRLALVCGEIAGCLGYIPADVNVGSHTLNGAWLANWMVDPEKRHLGLGPQLVSEVTKDFDVTLALGASLDAREILERMGWTDFNMLNRYVQVLDPEQASLLTREGWLDWPTDVSLASTPSIETVRLISRFDNEVTTLWDRVWGSQRRAAGTRRTAQFLNWRYADHPQFDYRLFEARTAGKLRGFGVYRVESVQDLPVRVGRIVELVAERDFETRILNAIVTDARSNEVAALDFFCASDRLSNVFTECGFLPGTHPSVTDIPLLYQPIDRRKTGITFLADLQNIPDVAGIEDWYVTKSDGDQDRPN